MTHASLFSAVMDCKCKLYLLILAMPRKRNPVYDSAYELYLDGYSLEQVANEIGVTRQCVYKAFKKRGFKLRGPNFKPL